MTGVYTPGKRTLRQERDGVWAHILQKLGLIGKKGQSRPLGVDMSDVKIDYRPKIVEGIDYYREPGGRMIFTEAYHLRRGYCCNGKCRHCPWKLPREEKSDSGDVPCHVILKGI